MDEIRFIHTADLHLDSPFLGLDHLPKPLFQRLQESTFTALKRIVDSAIERNVDFVLIAGDLFDGEDRSIKAQALLRNQLQRLSEKGIFTFISHGNHDHLAGDWMRLEMPEKVHIFNEKVSPYQYTTQNGLRVNVYGFSYPERHVMTRKIEEYEIQPGADFHIAMLHGSEEGQSGVHHPYAPFSLNDLLRKGMDYWALGHIHKRQILHEDPYIIYPGNTQGRHRKESGRKGCYFVKLAKHGSNELEYIETADVRWEEVHIEIQKKTELTDLYIKCMQAMESLGRIDQSILCSIILSGSDPLSSKLLKTLENGEFIEMLQEETLLDGEFVWPYQVKYKAPLIEQNELKLDEALHPLLDEAISELDQGEAFNEVVSELFSHIYGSRYLNTLDEKDRKATLASAKETILRGLSDMD